MYNKCQHDTVNCEKEKTQVLLFAVASKCLLLFRHYYYKSQDKIVICQMLHCAVQLGF